MKSDVNKPANQQASKKQTNQQQNIHMQSQMGNEVQYHNVCLTEYNQKEGNEVQYHNVCITEYNQKEGNEELFA